MKHTTDSTSSTPRTPRRSRVAAVALLACLALIASACGGEASVDDVLEVSSDPESIETGVPAPTAAVVPTATPLPAEPTSEPGSIQDVEASTIKIIADGSFVPPFETQLSSSAGIGSGFIISEDGLAVTNNHVVTGAALLQVYLSSDTEPRNARILGVSECNDLALIDLEGEGYTPLEFRTEPVNAGLTIFAAGYPLNFDTNIADVDYTLTTGIVSTTQAGGDSNWTSVDGVIEHDARIRGGNSGGPLVDEQGRIVGINFAGDDVNDLNFAIAAQDARATIDALRDRDVESIGINGQAIVTEDLSGVWVAAVESGTPADRAGIEPGDLITRMQGLPLATDGTLADYCDIIRTNGPEDTLSIEVLRIGSEQILEGQINGEPLEESFSFAMELAEDVGGSDTSAPVGAGYGEYEFITDDSGSVGVEVPTEWTDRNGLANDDFGPSIWAAPNLETFNDTWDAPGIIVEVSTDLTSADVDSVLDIWDPDCTANGREDFQTGDEAFTGRWEIFTNCGGTDTSLLAIAASPASGQSVVRMLVQIVDDRDLAAADRAIASFDAIG